MTQEAQNEFFNDQLERLRTRVGEDLGLADMVDRVYMEAEHMGVGDILEFDARHSTLHVELTVDGFKTQLIPKELAK